jgi:hypothetical protein
MNSNKSQVQRAGIIVLAGALTHGQSIQLPGVQPNAATHPLQETTASVTSNVPGMTDQTST